MGILRTAIAITGWSTLGGAIGLTVWTRNSKIHPIPANDYIFNHTLFARYNPNNNPVMHNVCVRTVPIDKIRPELLEKEGMLVEAFAAGVYGGWGYAIQRRILERRYRTPDTASQLWDVKQLRESTYDIGTQITDHAEVMAKNTNSIIVRSGDNVAKTDPRESDGLFEMVADVKQDEGVVEFELKALFYNGVAMPDNTGKVPEPVSSLAEWFHERYDKVLMETAIKNCMR